LLKIKEVTAGIVLNGCRSVMPCTGCGRKNSPVWEANKFKTKEDTADVFLFLESTQNAVLHQRVLNKTSLKWWS